MHDQNLLLFKYIINQQYLLVELYDLKKFVLFYKKYFIFCQSILYKSYLTAKICIILDGR